MDLRQLLIRIVLARSQHEMTSFFILEFNFHQNSVNGRPPVRVFLRVPF